MTKAESLTLLKRPKILSEMKDKITLMKLSSSLSKTFVQYPRSDLLKTEMYLLWHKGFKLKNKRVLYHDIIMNLSKFNDEDRLLSSDFVSHIGL